MPATCFFQTRQFFEAFRWDLFLTRLPLLIAPSDRPFAPLALVQVEIALEARGMTTEQVQQIKDHNWSFFLKRCRRLVPPSNELLKRFNRVIEEFGNCVDNDSREVLLRPMAVEAVDRLREHIVAGCLSDPEGIAMYYAAGKTKDGLPDYHCVRGTNDVEVRCL